MHTGLLSGLPCAWAAANQRGGQGIGDEGEVLDHAGEMGGLIVDAAERGMKEENIRVRV